VDWDGQGDIALLENIAIHSPAKTKEFIILKNEEESRHWGKWIENGFGW
jgi:hypothetical protein